MFKTIFSIAIITVVALYLFGQCSKREPVTRGDILDRNAASEAQRCARQYLSGAADASARSEIWDMCIGVAAETSGRNPEAIRRHIRP